ncbi:hypothetical protein [Tropicibacter naphthalenivorans]|uniref:Uncharacterized protein n=1 Tax=Tropicibacter naphthalenivorans TaxID=441103 RepID=A0A0P1G1C0_9RHOB|nr:hypothetical protein [Tropicibacter naphthalenivorans]CUH75589.1 hypothetical protein TRN7648_00516 [Tropicibacter naphthalenivorans]SMC43337.1 hypothetical protein SAMN04488093_101363 [Tropicibacter naphthalenivorans]
MTTAFGPLIPLCLMLLALPAAAQEDSHDHDHIEDCPPFAWGAQIDPGTQTYSEEIIAGFDDGRIVMKVTFDALSGPYAKRLMFLELIDYCVLRAVSVGSYPARVQQTPDTPWHVDFYEADNRTTLATLPAPPPADTVEAQAIELFLNVDIPALPPLAPTGDQMSDN